MRFALGFVGVLVACQKPEAPMVPVATPPPIDVADAPDAAPPVDAPVVAPAETPLPPPTPTVPVSGRAGVTLSTDWRTPGSPRFIGFVDDNTIVVTTPRVGVFDANGHRVFASEAPPTNAVSFSLVGATSIVIGGEKSAVSFDLATHAMTPLAVDGRLLATNGREFVVGKDAPSAPLEMIDGKRRVALQSSRGYRYPIIVGDWVIAARAKKAIAIWDLATGARRHAYGAGDTPRFALAADHRHLATTGADTVEIYALATGKQTASIEASCRQRTLAMSADGTRLAIACDDATQIVDVPSGKLVKQLAHPNVQTLAIGWSPSGAKLALAGADHTLYAWTTADWKLRTNVIGPRGSVDWLEASPLGVVAPGWSGPAGWWRAAGDAPIELGGGLRSIDVAAFSATELLLGLTNDPASSAATTAIERWVDGKSTKTYDIPRTGVHALGALADGGVWYCGDDAPQTIDATGKPAWTSPFAGRCAGTRDGRRIFVRGDDKLGIVDAVARKVVATAPTDICGGYTAIAPDGSRAALLHEQGIRIVDTKTARATTSLAFRSDGWATKGIAFHGADEIAVVAEDKLLTWKIGARTANVVAAPGVTSLAIDGDTLYLGFDDGSIERTPFSLTAGTSMPAKPAATCVADKNDFDLVVQPADELPRGPLDPKGAYDD